MTLISTQRFLSEPDFITEYDVRHYNLTELQARFAGEVRNMTPTSRRNGVPLYRLSDLAEALWEASC